VVGSVVLARRSGHVVEIIPEGDAPLDALELDGTPRGTGGDTR
jgi:hypothetical protein